MHIYTYICLCTHLEPRRLEYWDVIRPRRIRNVGNGPLREKPRIELGSDTACAGAGESLSRSDATFAQRRAVVAIGEDECLGKKLGEALMEEHCIYRKSKRNICMYMYIYIYIYTYTYSLNGAQSSP